MKAELYWIDGSWPGRLAIAPRPRGGDWLEDELKDYRRSGVDVIVCLLTNEELTDLELLAEEELCRANGMAWLSLPLEDRGVPTSTDAAQSVIAKGAIALREGKNVLVHCRQGIGRAGMIASSILNWLGVDPVDAMSRVGKARGLAVPETTPQRQWVLNFAPLATK